MTYSSKSNAVKISRSDAIAELSVLRSVITGIVLFMLGLFLFFSTQHAEAKVKKPGGPGMFIPVSKVGGRALGASTSFSKTGKQTSCDTVEYRIRYTLDVDDPTYLDDPTLIDVVDKTDVEIEDVLPAGLSATNVTISGDITDGAGGLPVAAISSGANPNDTIGFTGVKFSLVDLDGDGSLTSRSFEIVITAKIDPAAFPAPSMVDNQAFIIAKLGGITSTTASHDPAVPDDGDPETGDPTSVFIDLTDCDTPPPGGGGGGGGTPESEPCFKVEKGVVDCAKDGSGAIIYNMPVGPEMAGRSIELVSLTPGVTIAPVSQIVPAGGGILTWTINGAAPGMTVSLSVVGMELGAGPAEGWGLCCAQRIDFEVPADIECAPEDESPPEGTPTPDGEPLPKGKPDIEIRKKAEVDHCTIAGACDFTITVRNVGDGPYTGKIALDEETSPGNATLVGAPNAPWTCAPNTSPMMCWHPSTTLNPGESVELKLSFIPGPGWDWREIKNCAFFNYDASGQPAPFGRLDNDKACASIPIQYPEAPEEPKETDLELKKEHSGMTCDPEGICYFFIYIKNVGTENFNGPLSVVDNYMSGAPLASEFAPSPPWNCAKINPTQFRCDSLGNINLPAGAFTRIRIMTTVDPAKMAGGIVENCATLDAVPGETNLDNQKDCAKIPVAAPEADPDPKKKVDLIIRKSGVFSKCTADNVCEFIIGITNLGPDVYEGPLSFEDTYPLGAPESSVFSPNPPWNCAQITPASFRCQSTGNIVLAPGTTSTVTVSAVVDPAKFQNHVFENCVKLAAVAGETNLENQNACAEVEILAPQTDDSKLEIEKACRVDDPGSDADYWACKIKVTNSGATAPSGSISILEKLTLLEGANIPEMQLTPSGVTCVRENGAEYHCSIPGSELLPGTTKEIDVTFGLDAGHRFENCATLTVAQADGGSSPELGKACATGAKEEKEEARCTAPLVANANGRCACPQGSNYRRGKCINADNSAPPPPPPPPAQKLCNKLPGQIRTEDNRCICRKGTKLNRRRTQCIDAGPVLCKLKPGQVRVNGKCVCPRGETFSNRRKRCVPVQCRLKPGQIRTENGQCVCPRGERFSNRRNRCVSVQCRLKPGQIRTENGQCVCPKGETFSNRRNRCVSVQCRLKPGQIRTENGQCVCPRGERFNNRRNRCVPVQCKLKPGQIRTENGQCVCPRGERFNNRRNRCLPVQCRLKPGQIRTEDGRCVCPRGERFSNRYNKCVPRQTKTCQPNTGLVLRNGKCVCDRGLVWDPKGNECEPPASTSCPKGQKYNQRRKRCVATQVGCGEGQRYDRRRKRCVATQPDCARGQKYDRRRKRCVATQVDCAQGQRYDRRRKRCVATQVDCAQGQRYDRRRKRCVATQPGCGQGQKYDRRRKRCVSAQPGCGQGQKYDRRRKRCVSAQPGCGQGQKYDRRRKRCVSAQPGCGQGQKYDRRRKRCVSAQPGCGQGQKYDRRRKRCVSAQPGCGPGQKYDRRRKRCVSARPGCGQGQKYDRRRKRCVSAQPGCGAGQKYDRRRKRCVSARPGCGAGQKYDRRRKRCVSAQPGCRKGQVRKGNHCVTIQKGPGRPRCRRGEVRFRGKCVQKLI